MSKDKEVLQCSFCSKARDEVQKLIAGPGVFICNECVELSYNIVRNKYDESADTTTKKRILTPCKIRSELDKHIIGQDDAKELLSVSAYNHYKRISTPELLKTIEKSNILLLGSTGTGKTLLASTLSKILDVPFAITDATTLTEAGYAGEDVGSILERLLLIANNDVAAAQHGIVYIDEIDKKAKRFDQTSTAKDINGEGVQQSLLRLMEGCVINVYPAGKQEEPVEFDTTNVLFIVGGSFVGIEDVIKQSVFSGSKIGFTADVRNSNTNINILQHVTPEHVIKYGIIPEFVGRLAVLATLEELSVEQLIRVLTDVENNFLDQYKTLLELDEIKLTFSDEYIHEASVLAHKQKIGTRALKGIIENSLINIMYRAPELRKKGVTGIRFDKYPSTQHIKPILIYGDKELIDKSYKFYRGNYARKE